MASEVNRRDFLSQLGMTVGAAAAGAAAGVPLLGKAEQAEAQEVSATGEEIGDLFGIDLDVAL